MVQVFSIPLWRSNLRYQLHAGWYSQKNFLHKMNLQLDTLNALALHPDERQLQMHLRLNADFSSTSGSTQVS